MEDLKSDGYTDIKVPIDEIFRHLLVIQMFLDSHSDFVSYHKDRTGDMHEIP